jgi:DNA-binding IclR family transcriptional regulator
VLFEYRYFGATDVSSGATASSLSFAPDTRRAPTFLSGRLRKKLPFRETISALHHVVVSDLRFRPRDRTAYLEWRAQQDEADLATLGAVRRESAAHIAAVRAELEELRRKRHARWNPFYNARTKFFGWLYKKHLDAWLVLDPVISVHPDTVSFECFSLDESSYGRLACSHEVFEQLGELAYGTTNVDYSAALYDEFQKIRDDKETSFKVDPAGFEVQTGEDEGYREVKIDLPDSWVRGFLQVGTAMGLPGAVRLHLHPMDVHNLCFVLRRHKEIRGPRSLRFVIEPGRPVKVIVEPFGITVECPRSTHDGKDRQEIRIWGRRRLHVLERLIPVSRAFTVVLLGSGMPSFWLADCGDLTFTLGLSGWTANDWAASGNFDLLAPRGEVDADTAARVLDALRARWLATPDELGSALGLDRGTVESALVAFAQAGRAMYDLSAGVWRLRELTRDPLDLATLRWANAREQEAAELVASHGVRVSAQLGPDGRTRLDGKIGKDHPVATLDADRRLVAGHCTCNWHFQNKLRKGPCAHLLAIRLAHERRIGALLTELPTPPAPEIGSRGSAPAAGSVGGSPPSTNRPALSRPTPFPKAPKPKLRAMRVDAPPDEPEDDGDEDEVDEIEIAPRQTREPRVIRRDAATTSAVIASEADRFVDLLVERGLVELAPERGSFGPDVGALLRIRGNVNVRARGLFQLFERHPAVVEFYVLEEEDLVALLEEWG